MVHMEKKYFDGFDKMHPMHCWYQWYREGPHKQVLWAILGVTNRPDQPTNEPGPDFRWKSIYIYTHRWA